MRLTQFAVAAVLSVAVVLPAMAQTATAPATATPAPATTTTPGTAPTTATAPLATTKPAATAKAPKLAPASAANPVNINTASAEALDTLPGIGKKRAARIIEHRPYTTLDQLVSKKAVGPKVFEKIKDKITL